MLGLSLKNAWIRFSGNYLLLILGLIIGFAAVSLSAIATAHTATHAGWTARGHRLLDRVHACTDPSREQ